MKLYTRKDLKCGFIILCSEHNPDLLRYTARSIQMRYGESSVIAVTEASTKDNEMREMKAVCPTYKGQKTFTSLINVGFKHTPAEWNFILMAGTTMRTGLDQKMSLFIESEKDVLFPIANGKYNFIEGTLNGMLLHKKTFKDVGDMPNEGSLEMSKAEWAMKAIEKGVHFKAVIGAKLC